MTRFMPLRARSMGAAAAPGLWIEDFVGWSKVLSSRAPDAGRISAIAANGTEGLRRLVRSGEVSPARAAEAIADLADLDLHRRPHLDLLTRAWKLRGNVTAYHAMYVALAEALDAPLTS